MELAIYNVLVNYANKEYVEIEKIFAGNHILEGRHVQCITLFFNKQAFEKWVSKMCYRACSNEQFIRQDMKNKMTLAVAVHMTPGCPSG